VDFFTSIVDDAYTFGVIAATNALSDLYAMGAKPLFALNLVAWPRKPELLELLGDTLRGGADAARRAGLLILGGHSIDDPEPKYGLVALGEAHPDRIVRISGARPGDRLILTKPIGTGILSTALKRDLITESDMAEAVRSMTTLNAAAMDAMMALGPGVHACTDVSGFGLLGHLHNLVRASGVGARLQAGAVPVFAGVPELAAAGAVPGGTTRNLEAAAEYVRWDPGVSGVLRTVLADAQTSGGLLVAVSPEAAPRLLGELAARATLAVMIGEVIDRPAGVVEAA
jgi:selenide,water dikinase